MKLNTKTEIKKVSAVLLVGLCMALSAAGAREASAARQKVVAIDAGHQLRGNNAKEPNGPGSSTKKAKVTSGTSGCATKLPEYKLNLQVAKKLKKELEGRKILEQKTIQMVIVGAITPFKGQEDLVKACGVLIKREITDFHLLIVGAGEKSYIKMIEDEIRRQNLEKHVTLYGVSNDVYSLYEKSDIAFACGAKEAYGRTTVEAMLSGCLVVGVDCGATPELIRHGETGLLYESGNIESLAECIIKAISKREWCQEIARSGQAYAMKRFTKESSLRQILAVYDKVMKNDSV